MDARPNGTGASTSPEEPSSTIEERTTQGPGVAANPTATRLGIAVADGKEHCPQCGRVLDSHRCKLVCECGYFMSCSDF